MIAKKSWDLLIVGVAAFIVFNDIQNVSSQFNNQPTTIQYSVDSGLSQSIDQVTTPENSSQPHPVEELTDEIIKTVNENAGIKAPESASKVIMPISGNSTLNDIVYMVKNHNRSPVRPATHKVEKLETWTKKPMKKKNDLRAQIHYDDVTGELIGGDHPCNRECKEGEEPMICYYRFNIEAYQTMSKACFDCPYVESDCSRLDCIPTDGANRAITVINRKLPGPAIEVCHHDRVIVDLENHLMVDSTTVHWHGQHQKGSPYMDGTPYITQCPVLPETTFRYQFNATNAGTHFWHSHSGLQRADGAAGAMVIRKPKSQEPHGRLYDYDRPDHTIVVFDWIHELSSAMFTDHHHAQGDNKPPTLLVNGRGRFQVFRNHTEGKEMFMRAARFNVEQGFRYRFRIINAEFLNCPIEVTVDGHNITVIASDGQDLMPVTAKSLVSYAGERFDFIVEANQEIDNYWIHFRGLMDCDDRFTKARQVAVLHYDGAIESEPHGDPTWEEAHLDGLQLNALNKGEEENETISVAELRSLDPYDDSLKEVADYQFYVAYDFYPKNNSHFHKSPYYGYYQVPNAKNRVYTPQLNHISMKLPSSPLLLSRPSPEGFCNSSSISEECKQGYCECPHVLSVRKNAVVEVIIVDEGVTFDANHPFHLHGHSFRVVGMRRLNSNTTVEEVKAFDQAGLLKRNLRNAPIKDTVTVPDGGYTVIRFKADNPGYWLFHCHLEFHVEIGMAIVFKVGEHKDMPPIPPGFPRCGNYMPDNMLEHATTQKPPDDSQMITFDHWWPVIVLNNTGSASTASLGYSPLSLTLVVSISLILLYVDRRT